MLQKLLLFGVFFAAVFYVFTPYKIDGTSMSYGLVPGDYVVTSKLFSQIQRGDILVIKHPLEEHKRLYIKRCIAIGGDVVFEKKRDFYLQLEGNSTKTYSYAQKYHLDFVKTRRGFFLKNPYEKYYGVIHNLDFEVPRELQRYPLTTIKPQHYFMVGDYRDNSADSRFYGAVPKKWVVSKVIFIMKKPRSLDELLKIKEL